MIVEPLKAEPSKRKRRWFQFSLRTLMIVVTLLAAICPAIVWVARDRDRLIRERDDALDRAKGPSANYFSIHRYPNEMFVSVPVGTPPEEIARLQRLYPGARISLVIPGPVTGRIDLGHSGPH
jgi:hypothetical protein